MHVIRYKIVFNFGVAIGASYGAFKLSLLDVNLGAIGLLMIANPKNLRATQFVVGFLFVTGAISMIAVRAIIPSVAIFLSNDLTTFF